MDMKIMKAPKVLETGKYIPIFQEYGKTFSDVFLFVQKNLQNGL